MSFNALLAVKGFFKDFIAARFAPKGKQPLQAAVLLASKPFV